MLQTEYSPNPVTISSMAIDSQGNLQNNDDFIVYAIYDHPTDYPDKFVTRKWNGPTPDITPLIVCDTIEEARTVIPEGYINMGQDLLDPIIIEHYIKN